MTFGNQAIEFYYFESLQSAILKVQRENYCILVSRSECKDIFTC